VSQKLGGKRVHGKIGVGECEDGYMDKMFPLCWYLWRKTSWKRRLETHFHQEWSEDMFRKRICSTNRGITNGVRVMLWMWDNIEKKEILIVL
jgi:hypothetical protein